MRTISAHRLFSFADEVVVSKESLREAMEVLRKVHDAAGGRDEPAYSPIVVPGALAAAKFLLRVRRMRMGHFRQALFGEPAWEMLLALYVAHCEQYRLKVSALCAESGVPATTALRWLTTLIEEGLAERKRCPTDARIVYVELTKAGLDKIHPLMERVSNGDRGR